MVLENINRKLNFSVSLFRELKSKHGKNVFVSIISSSFSTSLLLLCVYLSLLDRVVYTVVPIDTIMFIRGLFMSLFDTINAAITYNFSLTQVVITDVFMVQSS